MSSNDTAHPRFFVEAIQNMALSEKEGRPIFEDKEMVEVRLPGDRLMNWVGSVHEKMLINKRIIDATERWPEAYAAFKRGEQRATVGTPLEHWPNVAMTASKVAELKAINIFSVEELATVSDNVLPKIGWHGRELREQARVYIESAKGSAATSALASENAELRKRLEALEAAINKTDPKEKALEDCTDQELKEFIKRVSGEGIRGNPTRETLLSRAADLAQADAA